MLEFIMTLTHADGSARTITVRIGDVRRTHEGTANPWSAAVEIHGFTNSDTSRIRGRDWAEAIEDAARFAAIRVADKADAEGGGELEPPVLPRARGTGSSGTACRIADDENDAAEP